MLQNKSVSRRYSDRVDRIDCASWDTPVDGASENSVFNNVRTAAGVLYPFASKISAISFPLGNMVV
jgi:hypothetical protein